MIFPFEVKKNGIYYPAGTDVPIRSDKRGDKPPVVASGKVEEPVIEKEEKPVEKKAKAEKKPVEKKRKYSEKDLDMPDMSLKSLAKSEGFKVPNTAKADEIKEMLRTL